MARRRRLAALRREELLELRDDLVANRLAPHVEQERDQISPGRWPFWIERYVEAETQLLCHFRTRHPDGSGDAGEFFAVIKRPDRGELMLGEPHIGKATDPEGDGLSDGAGQMELSMLVGAVEYVEGPKPVQVRPLASVARLAFADQILGFPTEAANLSSSLLLEQVGVGEDGELRPSGRVTIGTVDECELPGQVIESRPKVEQGIAELDRPFADRWPLQDLSPQDAIACVRIFLADDAVRTLIEEPFDVLLEDFRVMIRPVELGENPL